MKISDEEVNEIIEILVGTTDSLNGAILEVTMADNLTAQDLSEAQVMKINHMLFLCEECEWWYAFPERNKENGKLCINCEPEKDNNN